MSSLELQYWPEENGEGCSAWRLARKDNQPVTFPSTFNLMRIYRRRIVGDSLGLTIIRRGDNFRIVRMRTRLPKRLREIFLEELEGRVKLR